MKSKRFDSTKYFLIWANLYGMLRKKNYITWRPTNKSLIWNSRCRAKKILEYFVEVSLYPSITFMSPNHDAVKIEKLNENLDLESRFLIRWISWSDVFKVDAYIVQHNSSVELRLGSNRLSKCRSLIFGRFTNCRLMAGVFQIDTLSVQNLKFRFGSDPDRIYPS